MKRALHTRLEVPYCNVVQLAVSTPHWEDELASSAKLFIRSYW
jgi:hypothetical protein